MVWLNLLAVKNRGGLKLLSDFFDIESSNQFNIELLIQGKEHSGVGDTEFLKTGITNPTFNVFQPVVYDGITLETKLIGEPSKLTFTIIKDDALGDNGGFSEGAAVRLIVNGVNVFYGFVFEKSRDKNQHIQVTCYDQLRYLKNKHRYIYENKTASDLIKMFADDFLLRLGEIEDTEYQLSRDEDGQTLFDIILYALDETMYKTNNRFVLYDDFGKITLKHVKNMKVNCVIDADTIENFDYSSSIDKDTYNVIRLGYKNEATGKFEITQDEDPEHVKQWGVLEFYETVNDNHDKIKTFIKNFLDSKKGVNRVTRDLSVRGALGDLSVRAGSLVPVMLELGDVSVRQYLLVESCTHTFYSNKHTMDLHLTGGGMGFE